MQIFRNKFLVSAGLVCAIFIGVALVRLFEVSSEANAYVPSMGQAAPYSMPGDFDWKTYVQNYEDLRLAGIDNEKRARQHWLEYGKKEGRTYHQLRLAKPSTIVKTPVPEPVLAPVRPPVAKLKKTAKLLGMTTYRASQAVPRVSIDPPRFDPTDFRSRYNKVLERAGVKTKEEAMELSLAMWEKRRKTYFS